MSCNFHFTVGVQAVSLMCGSTTACFIRHKAFMSHSCRRSHCGFTGRGQQGESHGEEKEEELKIEDLRRAGLEVTLQKIYLITLWRPNEVRPLLLSGTICC